MKMRAIQIEEYGGINVLKQRDVAVPVPGKDEVLVKLAYAGINFMDVYTRLGNYARSGHYQATLPLTLGMEGAGRIKACGPGVIGFKPGDRVAYCLANGSYADYAIVPAWKIVKVPDGLSLKLAAASLFQGLTAHYLVHDVANLKSGDSCLVHAGAGGIGQIVIQLVSRQGVHVIATASSPEKADIARQCGAERVCAYDPESVTSAVKAMTAGRGVDVVFDSVGAATFQISMHALKKAGLLIAYGANSGPFSSIDPMELANNGSLFFTRPRLADYVPDAASIRRRADNIFAGLMDGRLNVHIDKVFDFEAVAAAHSKLEERRSIGKSVLCINADEDCDY
jgi:NADPH2:quinone reductase